MPSFSNGFAVLTGIADYRHINGLPQTVVDDAKAIESLLVDPDVCGYARDRVVHVPNKAATKDAIVTALQDAAGRCNNTSTFVFYVSAHGGRIENGDHRGEFLLPVDTIYTDDATLAKTAISGRELSDLLNSIPAQRLVVLFDCCHAAGIGYVKGKTTSGFNQGLPERYYKEISTGKGRVILASCRDSEFSYVRPGDPNSVFTKYLIQGLRGAAPGPGGFIRVFDLFHYLQPLVVADQGNQHPVFKCEVEDNFPVALHTGGKGTPLSAASDTPRNGFEYDVFLSYRQQETDRDWVRKVFLPKLRAYGFRVCVDFECFRLGEHLIAEMERAVESSRYTLAVLSPAYLESNFTELENILAEHLGLENGERRLIAVMRETCEPRLRMRSRLWLDMRDDTELEANFARLAHEICIVS